jgi:hypothetical protein
LTRTIARALALAAVIFAGVAARSARQDARALVLVNSTSPHPERPSAGSRIGTIGGNSSPQCSNCISYSSLEFKWMANRV